MAAQVAWEVVVVLADVVVRYDNENDDKDDDDSSGDDNRHDYVRYALRQDVGAAADGVAGVDEAVLQDDAGIVEDEVAAALMWKDPIMNIGK